MLCARAHRHMCAHMCAQSTRVFACTHNYRAHVYLCVHVMYTCTSMHAHNAHVHKHVHTRECRGIHVHTHACTQVSTCTCVNTYTHVHAHNTHSVHVHKPPCAHTCTCTPMCPHTFACTHTQCEASPGALSPLAKAKAAPEMGWRNPNTHKHAPLSSLDPKEHSVLVSLWGRIPIRGPEGRDLPRTPHLLPKQRPLEARCPVP